MAVAAEAIADFLADQGSTVDAAALHANADAYVAELEALDSEVQAMMADIPQDRRVLVTNHEVFGYFADRYDLDVVGTVIPGQSTTDTASGQALDRLVDVIEDHGVPAIFADTSSSDDLARTLANEVGDVSVVELFSESLGQAGSDGGTYLEMVQANATLIASALAG